MIDRKQYKELVWWRDRKRFMVYKYKVKYFIGIPNNLKRNIWNLWKDRKSRFSWDTKKTFVITYNK